MIAENKSKRAFGTWPSKLGASEVTASSSAVGIFVEYQSRFISTESRPDEAGRIALVRRTEAGHLVDVLPSEFSVRTRVHEYGGRAWWIGQSQLYFCHWADQRLYARTGAITGIETPLPLTPEPLESHNLRFADGVETPDGDWVIAVAEVHGEDKSRLGINTSTNEAANVIVAIPTNGSAASDASKIHVLAQGADFVSNPRISNDGTRLCWVQWHHPNMPWDTTELMVAGVLQGRTESITGDSTAGTVNNDMSLTDVERVAGGQSVSIVGPQWVEDSRLVFSSDQSGWWNLYAYEPDDKKTDAITALDSTEIGAPAWAIGTCRFVELTSLPIDDELDSRESAVLASVPWLVVSVTERGSDWLAVVYTDGSLERLALSCAAIRGLSPTPSGGVVALVEYHDAQSQNVVFTRAELRKHGGGQALLSADAPQGTGFVGSMAQPVEFISEGDTSHAFFYPPTSENYIGPIDEKPPLIVMGHGGPTSHATPSLKLATQFWTSRGFAVADVNYRGSTGFGRVYRQKLNEAWGVVDVEDCISVVRHLCDTGRVDPKRCVIRGGSAGGLTVLRALQLSDVFAAGTSLYGVADLKGLMAETHKFESRYLDNLIGEYPQHSERYTERSPINFASNIKVPLLVLQGDEDKVVPPSQSEAIVSAVAEQGLPHAYVVFEGEQHGWRKKETLIRALELELWFYGAALGFKPADAIRPPEEASRFTET